MSRFSKPPVTVIMNCLNGEQYLREAIDSVYAQTGSDWEIVFWDNGSTDASADIARSYDERLRYFCSAQTVPLYEARNRALEQARGAYIGFLDTDDAWLPAKLAKQLPLFEADTQVGLVYSNVEVIEEDGGSRLVHHGRQPSGSVFRQVLANYQLVLPGVMIARVALDVLESWFDPSMSGSGDTDLFLRICHRWQAAYLPDVTARYRQHRESLGARRPELFLREAFVIVNKLAAMEPRLWKDYPDEVFSFVAQRQKAFGVSRWRSGDGVAARRIVRGQLRAALSDAALYVLSFFKYRALLPVTRTRCFRLMRAFLQHT